MITNTVDTQPGWMVQLDWQVSTAYVILYVMKVSLFWILYSAEKVC